MTWPYQKRLEPLANITGLGMWAGSQMLLMITLARTLSLDLVGVFTLGLTVFSLLMVALGLNLRLAIAVDHQERIRLLPALAVRLGTALAVYILALAAMKLYAPRFEVFVLAALLLGGRIADQLVDIFYGFQQQASRNLRLSASFFIRGLLTCLLCLCLLLRVGTPLGIILIGTLLYCFCSLLLEVAWFPGWRQPGTAPALGEGVGRLLQHENVRSLAAFPLFDALHFSSFRLALVPVLDSQSFGLFALAANAFSAAQIVITAFGLTALTRLKAHSRAGDPLSTMLRDAGAYGAICLGFFALCSLAFGLLGALNVTDPGALDLFLAGNFVALMSFAFTGFLGQGAIYFGNRAGCWQAPLVGSLVFASAGLLLVGLGSQLGWPPMTSYFGLCGALFLSGAARIAVSLRQLGAPQPVRG